MLAGRFSTTGINHETLRFKTRQKHNIDIFYKIPVYFFKYQCD